MKPDTTQHSPQINTQVLASTLRIPGGASSTGKLASTSSLVGSADTARSVEDDDLWPWVPTADGGLEWRSEFT